MKHILFITILACSLSEMHAQQTPEQQIKTHKAIDKLQKALIEKDFSIIKNQLSADFKYNNYSGETARSVMNQVVQSYPLNLNLIRVLSVVLDGDDRVIYCLFIADGQEEKQEIILDADFKIKRADIVKIQAHNPHSNN